MNLEPIVAVYVREPKVYVAPQFGGPGLRIDISPVITTSTRESELANAIDQALHAAEESPVREMPNLRTYRSPVFAAAGVSSARKLEEGLKYFTVRKTPEKYEIQRYQRASDGGGFEAKEPPVELPSTTTMVNIARIIRESLKKPNGRESFEN